jgi:hypothetical protein
LLQIDFSFDFFGRPYPFCGGAAAVADAFPGDFLCGGSFFVIATQSGHLKQILNKKI